MYVDEKELDAKMIQVNQIVAHLVERIEALEKAAVKPATKSRKVTK